MSFTDLASLPRPTLIDNVLTHRDLWCKALWFSSRSAKWRKEIFFFFIDTPIAVLYFSVIEEFLWQEEKSLLKYDDDHISDLHHILCSLILEAQTGHMISSCKALMRKTDPSKVLLHFLCTLILYDYSWHNMENSTLKTFF